MAHLDLVQKRAMAYVKGVFIDSSNLFYSLFPFFLWGSEYFDELCVIMSMI